MKVKLDCIVEWNEIDYPNLEDAKQGIIYSLDEYGLIISDINIKEL